MKITDFEPIIVRVNQRGDWVFVRVHTDEGIVGLGEASHAGNDALLLAALAHYRERLIGQDPTRIQAIWRQLHNKNAGRVEHTALSGVEQALWDVLGQKLGAPIRDLFGGPLRDKLRLYANINRHVADRSPEGFARAAQQAVAEGFTAVKLAPFDELRAPDHVRTGPKAAWRKGVERVYAVRAAIGDEVELLVDCHERMDAPEAMMVAQALAEARLYWYEEPVANTHADDLARVSAAAPMPTASAESVYAVAVFAPFLQRRLVDILMPDVKHDGGLMETVAIAGAARAAGLLIAPHNPSGPAACAATAQVSCTLSNFVILEYAWGEVPWRAELLEPAERIENGYLLLPAGPGLGHRLNESVVAEHRREIASPMDSSKAAV